MKKLFRKNEAVRFKNKKEKKQLLNIALEYGFKWMSGKEVFDFEPPTHSNVLAFFRKSKKIGWAVANDIEKNTPANKFIKRFKKTELEKRVDEMQNSLNHALSIIDSKDRARQERLRELEQISNNIIKGYELVKNKKNDTLVLGGNMLDNINFKELSFEEAHKQAYESICKHYGITDTEVKGVTFNKQTTEEKPSFKPVFMKCTQEQFDRMRPKLESVCNIVDMLAFDKNYCFVTNSYSGVYRNISNIDESDTKRITERTEVHTEAEFLEACGYVEEKIEYTLENIQVDLSYVSDEQLENIKNILINNGYKVFDIWKNSKNNILRKSEFGCNVFSTYCLSSNFNTITYEKFMELFSEKPIEEEQKTVRISDLPVRNIEELHAEHKEAKREPKVGDVVKAWDNNKDKFVYGILNNINYLNIYVYTVGDTCYKNIEQVTEININDFKREEN